MVASVLMVSMLPGQEAGSDNRKAMETFRKLSKIEYATTGFMAAYGRRPCPADGQYDVDTAHFGVEAANPGDCTGGTPAAPFGPDDSTGHVVGGVVPTKTLGLEDDYAFDGWGRRITYLVDRRATDKSSCLALQNYPINNGVGGITIRESTSGDSISGVMAAYLSHGPDGHGAFPMAGSSVANRIHIGSTDTDTLTNAGVDSSFTYSTTHFTNTKVMKEKTMTYDDLTYYAEYQKNICCLGKVCVTPGFRIDGAATNARLGIAAFVMDLNNDGRDDLALGDNYHSGQVLFGQHGSWSHPFLPSQLDGGNGFRLVDNTADTDVGIRHFLSGDMDGDGIQDLVACHNWKAGIDQSGCWGWDIARLIIFGGQASWPAEFLFKQNGLDGTNGAMIGGRHWITADIGRFNDDHYSDILVYMISGSLNDYLIIPGQARPWSAYTDLEWGPQPAGVIRFNRDNPNSALQARLADVNGDGYADILAWQSMGADNTFLITHGGAGPEAGGAWGSGPYTMNDVNTPGNPTGTIIEKPINTGQFGNALAAGDINNDGITDLIIGDWDGGAWPPGGRSLIFFGGATLSSTSWPFEWDAATTFTGTNGFQLIGWWSADSWGGPHSVSLADSNGDGKEDIFYKFPASDSRKYIVKFSQSSYSASYTLDSNIWNGTAGFRITGNTSDHAWDGTLATGDVNGDGINDMILGYSRESPGGRTRAGRTYVIFGRASSWPGTVDLNSLNGSDGFVIEGINAEDRLGHSVAAADLNGDGIKDIVTCAVYADNNGMDSGSCYVIYGKRESWDAVFDLSVLQ